MNYVYKAVRPLRQIIQNLLTSFKNDRVEILSKFCIVYNVRCNQEHPQKKPIPWRRPRSILERNGKLLGRPRPYCLKRIVVDKEAKKGLNVYRVQEDFMYLSSRPKPSAGPITYRELPNPSDLLSKNELREIVLARTAFVHDDGDNNLLVPGLKKNNKCSVYLFVDQQ
ncbi:hypothetical protein RI129_012762 [Pyrocoelia pectoralis]|uniref:Uncharacterized protein n=1 Tax=Pyrocoelia pectoralis TaxID=417401 RepID=A0AAN7ZCE1_9COLE